MQILSYFKRHCQIKDAKGGYFQGFKVDYIVPEQLIILTEEGLKPKI